jgi:hypothetical protein
MMNSGFRFFRDDALLKLREEQTKYCKRCGDLYWVDESNDSFIAADYCKYCLALVLLRVRNLNRRDRCQCPVDSKEFIYNKGYNNWQRRYG